MTDLQLKLRHGVRWKRWARSVTRARAALIRATRYSDKRVRQAAAKALGEL